MKTHQTGVNSYIQTARNLHDHLPHLQNVLSEGRRNPVKVDCYDYAERKLLSRRTFRSTESADLLSDDNVSLAQILENFLSTSIQLRFLVANDLSIPLMKFLGFSLSINPEMFEEHLVNAGWSNGHYDDSESDTWITRNMIKNHTSVKWYRPVRKILPGSFPSLNHEDLLDSEEDNTQKWTEKVVNPVGKPFKIEHKLKPSTNILRRSWGLRADTEVTSSASAPTALEERATIWTKQFETGRIGAYC